jgi:hypothetical protein
MTSGTSREARITADPRRPAGRAERHADPHRPVGLPHRGLLPLVRPGELIVQTFTYEGAPDGVHLEKLRLEGLGGGRCLHTSTSLCDSFAERDGMVSAMDVGVHEGYAKLDALLAEG